MSRIRLLQGLYVVIITVLVSACGGGGNSGDKNGNGNTQQTNQAPIANTGEDKYVEIFHNTTKLVHLDGSKSSDDGTSLTYEWNLTVPAHSSSVLSDKNSQKPTFIADTYGTYTATLTVNDGEKNLL